MNADKNAVAKWVGRKISIHLRGHSRWRSEWRGIVIAENGKGIRALAQAAPNPEERVFILARLARNSSSADAPAPPRDVAHAVAKADRVGNCNFARRPLVANLHRAFGYRAA